MAKPRVFVSSTYYDLKHIRNSLEAFIDGLGYEPVLYEDGDIPFHHDSPLDISCYAEIKSCHILVLIIGGRYGSSASEHEELSDKYEFYNSVTKKEYETARKNDIPIYIFVEKNVLSEYHTYKKNRENPKIEYAHVDSSNIFKLIDDIYSQKRNNLVKDFEKFDDISSWLRDQWAGLFADLIAKKSKDKDLADLSTQISGLKDLSSILKSYTESIMEKLEPENFQQIIQTSNKTLKEKRIERFSENPMIQFFLSKSPKGIGKVRLFEAFEESQTLEEFMTKSGYDDEFIEDILHNSPGPQEYDELKLEFLI